MYKTIFARFGNIKAGKFVDEETGEDLNDVAKVLSKFNIELYGAQGNMNDVGEILDTVGNKWSSFTEIEQNAIATAIAGTRQRENFIVLMQNYGKVAQYTATALNSAGTAESKFGAYTQGIEAKLNALTSAIGKFSLEFLDSDLVIETVEKLTDGVEWLSDNLWLLELALKAVFVVLMYQAGTKIMALGKNIVTFGGKLNKNTLSIKAWGNAWKTAMMSNPVGWIMAIYSALTMVEDFISSTFFPSIREQTRETLEEIQEFNEEITNTKNKMTEAKRAYDQVSVSLEENLKAIKELESKGSMTYVEEIELQKLKQVTLELERQKELANNSFVSSSVSYYKKLISSADELENKFSELQTLLSNEPDINDWEFQKEGMLLESALTTFGVPLAAADMLIDSDRKAYKSALEDFNDDVEEAQNTLTETLQLNPSAVLKLDEEVFEYLIPDESRRQAAIAQALFEAEQMYYEIAKMPSQIAMGVYGSKEEWDKALDDMATMLYEKSGVLGDAYKESFVASFAVTGFPQFEETKKQLEELASQGKLTEDALVDVDQWDEYSSALKEFGLDTDTILRIYNDRFYEALDTTEELRTSLESLKEQLKSLTGAFESLNGIVDEYNSSGSLSYETWKKLIDLEDKYLSALIDEEGQIRANNEALKEAIKLKIEEATLTRIEEYVENLAKAAKNGTLDSLLKLTSATETNTEARLKNVLAIIASNSALSRNKDQILAAIKAMLQMSQSISLEASSTSDAKDATEDWEKVLDYANTILDEQIEKLEKEQEALEKLTEEKIKAHEAEIKRLEEEKEALEEKNEEKNKELELEELERNLQKAKQRTMRVYHEGKGWVWEQDPEALQEAQQELDDFHTEQQIENIEDLIKAEEEKIEELENNLDKEIESYEERIKVIKDYKEEWNKVKTEHEKAQNEIVAQAKLGANAEKEILMGADGRLKVLESFKTGYTKALEAVAKKTETSAKRIDTAFGNILGQLEEFYAEEEKDAHTWMGLFPKTSFGSEVSSFVENLLKKMLKSQLSKFGIDLDIDKDHKDYGTLAEKVVSFVSGLAPSASPAYASGTLSAKAGLAAGLATVDEKGNELIVPKQGRYRMMEYGDTVVPHNLSQRLFEVASNPLRFIANALNSVKTPNLMSNSNQVSNSSIIHIGTIELPSVTNGENFVRQLQLIAANR